jgi:hypothetical protein
MWRTTCILYYENAAGQLYQHPAGYAVLHFRAGQRQFLDFTTLLTQLGQLLVEQHWQAVLSDQYQMQAVTIEEKAWLREYWAGRKIQRPARVQVAVLDSRFEDMAALRWPE